MFICRNYIATNYYQSKVINIIIEVTDEEGKEILIHKLLIMIDVNHNEDFFIYLCKK